jgi:hypothetical protein
MRRVVLTLSLLAAVCALAPAAGARVLRVGKYNGITGQFSSIQAAVNAAKPGDWILVGPGDYKTSSIQTPKGAPNFPAGVVITTHNIHIRGMNRGQVIVDGTKPGSAVCSRKASAQNFGLSGASTANGYARTAASPKSGLNGVLIYKAANVSVENLTACNFLGGSRDAGNQIWWNGGANTGKVGGHGFYGAYLTATSTFLQSQGKAGEATAATYGIFSSNWSGGTWDHTYASNFNDSGYYIGACRQVCDQTLNHGWAQYSALGYSGSNSGGSLVVKNSEFDHNQDGFDTNSQNGDNPPPQDGSCPNNGISPITHTHSCWVFENNYVHDNNNPNVPAAGSAAAGPVGTGMSVSGARNDTIMNNRFVNNNAWGVIVVPYSDSGPPCTGGTPGGLGAGSCLFDEWGDALINNTFSHNGSYGHPSNGDFGEVNLQGGHSTDCYSGNHEAGGGPLTPASAAAAQTAHPACNGQLEPAGSTDGNFLTQVLCDAQVELTPGTSACPAGTTYPRVTHIVMHPLPKTLKTMPNVCLGVPSNPWCSRKKA